MALESGNYYIFSMITEGNNKIGRHWNEDSSLGLNPVVLLPETGGADDWSPEWTIEKKDDGYIMKSHDNYTTGLDKLVAILIPDLAPAQIWKITPQPQHGENVYTVDASEPSKGWVVPEPV